MRPMIARARRRRGSPPSGIDMATSAAVELSSSSPDAKAAAASPGRRGRPRARNESRQSSIFLDSFASGGEAPPPPPPVDVVRSRVSSCQMHTVEASLIAACSSEPPNSDGVGVCQSARMLLLRATASGSLQHALCIDPIA